LRGEALAGVGAGEPVLGHKRSRRLWRALPVKAAVRSGVAPRPAGAPLATGDAPPVGSR
jgi:hypothetical protein